MLKIFSVSKTCKSIILTRVHALEFQFSFPCEAVNFMQGASVE